MLENYNHNGFQIDFQEEVECYILKLTELMGFVLLFILLYMVGVRIVSL